MERIDTGLKDKNGTPIYTGDVVERIGLSAIPKRFVVFAPDWADEETRWRLDETGTQTALVYPWLDEAIHRKGGMTFTVLGHYEENPELMTQG